ncbi:ATP-dependent DNA ligase [Sinomonas mesophila]|uniref:ATP-dependent DNA ligase n=1 Tax=Sinomonas mesophila TaxID=1531955 RepID=UPI000987B1F7|nr:ATP-dependent DNA ligase [Sinomonas mesophila]
MDLPVMPPVEPMLARPVREIPDVGHSEPKWDGFRTIVFKDGDEVMLGSRNDKPMTRYFPELVEILRRGLPEKCVVDGEIVLLLNDRLDFEALQQRIHPADSRVRLLAEHTPSSLVAFDILALGSENLMRRPFGDRRDVLRQILGGPEESIILTPATADLEEAKRWFTEFEGAGLDGVIAKPLDAPYEPGKRSMFKIKHERTADCVVAGFRWHKAGGTDSRNALGSLLLGLYDDGGTLHHVGVAASFPMAKRRALATELAPLVETDLAAHPWGRWADQSAHGTQRLPGAVSRWSGGKDLSFVPLRPELVVEVAYDHMEGDRFRHTAQFRRWRTDRDPSSCTYAQLETAAAFDVRRILDEGR